MGRNIDTQLRTQRSALRELEEEAQEGAPIAMTVMEELKRVSGISFV
jgi:chaperonin cofactor prefoldin